MGSDLFTKGVAEAIGEEELAVRIASGAKLRVKLGIDPTSPDLHLGHAVVLRKLRAFQDAGHQAVLVIGDFTAMIGDPSGRAGARESLTKEQVESNLVKFLDQACLILDRKSIEVRRNSEWFGQSTFADGLALMGRFTLQQMSQREDFVKRVAEGKPVASNEIVYPMLQAYDSVMLKADVELGGTDQKLNLIAGRHLMEKMGLAPQAIVMMPLLIGTDGERKMSKSLGNYIALNDAPNEMFGKVMGLSDALMPNWFELLTDISVPEELKPRDAKALLARTIVAHYHGAEAGERAEQNFTEMFSEKKMPENIPELRGLTPQSTVAHALRAAGVADSAGSARRLIEQGGVKLDGKIVTDPTASIGNAKVLQSGKRHFFKIKK